MSEETKQKKVIRDFFLTTWALNNKNTVVLLAIILIAFGIYSYRSLPKELFPEIVIPTVMVQTLFPGNPPIDIENLITRELEKEIESVNGIKYMTSVSNQDVSNIFVEFNTNVDIKTALQDVKDAVDKAKKELPDDLLDEPMVTDIDLSEFPIININLSGDYSINELKMYAEFLEDEIESLSEISGVEITGITDREIKIHVDQHKLNAFELSFNDIENAIKSENTSISGGDIRTGFDRRAVRITGEFSSVKEIEDIIVKHENMHIVYLRDVADVSFGFMEAESYARLNHQPVVSLQVVKKSGENLLNATSKIFTILNQARETKALPADLVVTLTNDQSEQIKLQLSNLENSMIMGIIFVVFVLYFFLGTRNAMFVGIAIPFSMFISFMVMGIMDFQVNMIVLFSLILALGMLVDNAIVVVENIYRFVDKGYSTYEAVKQAVGEIAMPIISSTATTLAAFFPLIFWDSIMGEFMKFLPLTLIIVLLSSLFTALVIIPVISSSFIVRSDQEKAPSLKRNLIVSAIMLAFSALFYLNGVNILGSLLAIFALIGIAHALFLDRFARWFQNVLLVWVEKKYLIILGFALKSWNPLLIVLGTVFMLISTIAFYFLSSPTVEFFPEGEPKYINIMAELPLGTDIDATDSVLRVVEKDVYRLIEPESAIVKSVLTNIGKGAVGEDDGFTGRGGGPNRGLITVTFLDFQDRMGISTPQVLKRLSDSLIGVYPGVLLTVDMQNEGPPVGKPINIEISGREFDKLLFLTDTITSLIGEANIAGIEGLQIDLDVGKPELNVMIDRNRARRYGLSTGQIGNTIRTALFGLEISSYKIGEDEYPIMLRMKDDYRYNLASLLNQRVTFRDQASGKIVQVPISAVADVELSSTYGAVTRKDRSRMITIFSNVLPGYNANQINEQLKPILEDFNFPEGYKFQFTGEQQEQEESMAFLMQALLIAISIILLILVGQFNSIVKPGIIMASVLFSTIGVFGGLATFNMDFIVIMTGIGIVSLAGVVVNNAIVLIDYINLVKLRRKTQLDLPEEANLSISESMNCVVEAGNTRLRPVLLTAITTILGLLPLAVGLNIDFYGMLHHFDPDIYFGGDNALFWGPMSWTIIFGLSFATFLTLVVVPAMYHLLFRVKLKVQSIRAKG
jgi:multidrug efflux pump